jgi:hypothetical protein
LRDPISEKTYHKIRAGGMAQGVGLEFKPQYYQKKKKLQNKHTTKQKNKFHTSVCVASLEIMRIRTQFFPL